VPGVLSTGNFQVIIIENAITVGGKKCGCEARNTYTWGAEAGEVNEIN
jgi:hypothetical protein